ncbi:MAG TPA: hypothetical protein VFW22_16235 [Pseudolabrys sp.]|nr:hypothetical protein [Pseudolabrys sp.]
MADANALRSIVDDLVAEIDQAGSLLLASGNGNNDSKKYITSIAAANTRAKRRLEGLRR